MRFTINIDENKTIPLTTLAEFVTEQNIESVLPEPMVESLNAAHVEALCGKKHAAGNGNRRFQRTGTDTRTAVKSLANTEILCIKVIINYARVWQPVPLEEREVRRKWKQPSI